MKSIDRVSGRSARHAIAHRRAASLALTVVAALATLTGAARSASAQGIPGVPTVPAASGAKAPGAPSLTGTSAAPSADANPVITITATPLRSQVVPGDRIPVALVFELQPTWHIWPSATVWDSLPSSISKFDGAQLTRVSAAASTTPVSLATGAIQWPEYHLASADYGDGAQQFAVFEGRAVAYLPLIVAQDATRGAPTLEVTIDFQACNDRQCLMPDTAKVPIKIEIVPAGTPPAAESSPAHAALFGKFDPSVFGRIDSGELPTIASSATGSSVSGSPFRFQFLFIDFTISEDGTGRVLIILMVLVAGFLLNLTPCVLPVIPLKVMALTQMAGHRRRSILLGSVMSAGVIAFWLGLGLLMVSIKGIDAISILFQNPWVTLGIGVVIALMSIGMSGFFNFALPSFIYAFEPKHDSIKGSFLVGIMTAVLSTPCAGPFMGASLASAVKIQSNGLLMLLFLAIGVGMAVPYFVLSAFPGLVKRVPKAGPGSEVVKQVMGLLLLAAAFYFISSAMSGLLGWRGSERWWVVVTPAIAAGLWLVWRTLRITTSSTKRIAFGGIGVLIVAISAGVGHVFANQVDPVHWTLYSAKAEKEALAEGKIVVMKFTADWCLNCKVLEKAVLASPAVAARLSRSDVQTLIVDIGIGDDAHAARFKEAGSLTIPLLVVLAPDGQEVWRSEYYLPQQVIDAVDKAASMASASKGGAVGSATAQASAPASR